MTRSSTGLGRISNAPFNYRIGITPLGFIVCRFPRIWRESRLSDLWPWGFDATYRAHVHGSADSSRLAVPDGLHNVWIYSRIIKLTATFGISISPTLLRSETTGGCPLLLHQPLLSSCDVIDATRRNSLHRCQSVCLANPVSPFVSPHLPENSVLEHSSATDACCMTVPAKIHGERACLRYCKNKNCPGLQRGRW